MIEDIPKLLDELCVRLGLCLSPEGRAQIARSQFRDVDELEEALLKAEGLEPLTVDRRLRDELHELLVHNWK